MNQDLKRRSEKIERLVTIFLCLILGALFLTSCLQSRNARLKGDPINSVSKEALPIGPSLSDTNPSFCEDTDEETKERHYGFDERCILNKPVIYLYGYEGTDATVKVSLSTGYLKTLYPTPASSSTSNATWNVSVQKDGTLKNLTNGLYRYLFWDGVIDADDGCWTFDKGFCVKGKDTQDFLEEELTKLGLSDQEKEDFITYWVPRMCDNSYNVISFQTKTYSDKAKLTVEPAANSMIRVFMAWYKSDQEVDLKPQKFSVPQRKGRVIVEWGGTEVVSKETKEDEIAKKDAETTNGSFFRADNDAANAKNPLKFNTETNTETNTNSNTGTVATGQVPGKAYPAWVKGINGVNQAGAENAYDYLHRKGLSDATIQGNWNALMFHYAGHGTEGW